MIDPNKTYRTRDGREWRAHFEENSGALFLHVYVENKVIFSTYLSEVLTLADELRDQIPWEALRPEIQYVAMDESGHWYGYQEKPRLVPPHWDCVTRMGFSLTGVVMPSVAFMRWQETLIARPEDK